jgi:hypothetical protein
MSLIDLKTDLKSLKYGNDRFGGGDSGQPYIQSSIPEGNSISVAIDDGFIRGGIARATENSKNDYKRINRFLKDNPKGPLFIARQVGLQLSNPKLETKKGLGGFFQSALNGDIGAATGGVLQPTRIYNLGVNTLLQVGANAFGAHFTRHGILPIQNDNTKYLAVAEYNNNSENSKNNRLVSLKDKLIGKDSTIPDRSVAGSFIRGVVRSIPGLSFIPTTPKDAVIDDYLAGPGSVYGIGRTLLQRYVYTGIVDKDVLESQYGRAGKGLINRDSTDHIPISIESDNTSILYSEVGGAASTTKALKYSPIQDYITAGEPQNFEDYYSFEAIRKAVNENAIKYTGDDKTYKDVINAISASQSNPLLNIYKTAVKSSPILNSTEVGVITYKGSTGSYSLPASFTSWNKVSRENRVGSGPQDLINLTPLFYGVKGSIGDTINIEGVKRNINDLVKFRIQAINTDNPNNADWMIFRAYLTQFSDNIDATWSDVQYVGRGDKFYIYNGFTRRIQIGFKVAALSAQEMKPMYQKLNYLMSNLMPDYGGDITMRGPLVKMTVGNWIDGQDGIINSLNYTIPNDSPWEIAIGDEELILPHIVEVSMTFTPIGSQTRANNYTPQKSDIISNIAQNYNGANDRAKEYISPVSSSILKVTA